MELLDSIQFFKFSKTSTMGRNFLILRVWKALSFAQFHTSLLLIAGGTEENHYRIITRFIPKGSDIAVKETVWKILDELIPLEKLRMEMGEGFIIPSFLGAKV